MKQVYKAASLFALAISMSIPIAAAQESPAPETLPAPPAPPVFDEGKWQEWGARFEKSFDEKKWKDWGERFGKSFESFGEEFKKKDIAAADFNKKMKKLQEKLKDLKIPEIPALPPLPEIPPLPEMDINHFNWQLGPPSQDAVEKVKRLTKTYSVDANDQLAINNSYGKIEVNTWDRNEIKVDVEVKAYAGDDENAQKLLDGVTIANSKTNNLISFRTRIENNNRSNSWLSISFWNNGNGDKQKVEVYYTVYMPARNTLNLKTNYTNIVLPDLNGPVNLEMNYGDLTSGKLGGNINNITSNYGKIQIDEITNAKLNCSYGSFRSSKTKGIMANLNYCRTDLGEISGNVTVKMNYSGGFKISSFDRDFKSLNINANYSSVNLDFNGSEAFNFDIYTSYANFKYDPNQVTITSKTPDDEDKSWSSNKTYKGYYGKSPSGNIVIRSNYGGVKFN